MNELLQLMHDTVSKIGTIKSSVSLIKGGKLSKEENEKLLDAIEQRADELQKILDNYYTDNHGRL